jgi:hypothetical protein
MIVKLDREKLAETFEETVDPNLLYEENDDDVDQGATTHHHDHHHPLLEEAPVN